MIPPRSTFLSLRTLARCVSRPENVMFRNLDFVALNISGQQSELIELSLSFGFKGFDVDISDFGRQVERKGIDHARRLLVSANIRIGSFPLPVDWDAEEATFETELAELARLAELAVQIGCPRCLATVAPANDHRPYAENVDRYRRRFGQIGDVLKSRGIRLGLGFLAPVYHRREHAYDFVHTFDQLLFFVKSIGHDHVGVCLDTWHWHVAGGTVDHINALNSSDIGAVNLADAVTAAGNDDVNETSRLLPGHVSEDGNGKVDFPSILTAVAKIGFDGPLTVKPHPCQFEGIPRDQIVRKCSESIDVVWNAAGLNCQGKLVTSGA